VHVDVVDVHRLAPETLRPRAQRALFTDVVAAVEALGGRVIVARRFAW
jgi:hypothetical protein